MAAEAEGEVVAEVRSPMPLASDQIADCKEPSSGRPTSKLQVKVIVDPSVGGLVTKVGDTVLDGSIRGRFEELREQWG